MLRNFYVTSTDISRNVSWNFICQTLKDLYLLDVCELTEGQFYDMFVASTFQAKIEILEILIFYAAQLVIILRTTLLCSFLR